MPTNHKTVLPDASEWQYKPGTVQQHMPWREVILWITYHLRLLNWWLFLLMLLSFLVTAGLAWIQLQAHSAQELSVALTLSLFMLEPGAGLFAGVFASSLIIDDPLLELLLTMQAGIYRVVIWRFSLIFCLSICCAAIYLRWTLANRMHYAYQQAPLFFLLLWLSPVLTMSMLGLLGALITRNAALGVTLAAFPLLSALFLQARLNDIQAIHPFIISYTYWGEQDAPDWWLNRFTLLAIALILAIWNCWWLSRAEHLLRDVS